MRKAKIKADKRAAFVSEYLVDMNASAAAIRAGYSKKTARSQGHRLLTNGDIRERIDQALAKRAMANEITVDRVLKEISRVAFHDARKLFHADGRLKRPEEWDDDTAAVVSGIEVDEVKLAGGERVSAQAELELGDDPAPEAAGVVRIVSKIKRWDKGKALEQCMSYLGMHKSKGADADSALNLNIQLSSALKP